MTTTTQTITKTGGARRPPSDGNGSGGVPSVPSPVDVQPAQLPPTADQIADAASVLARAAQAQADTLERLDLSQRLLAKAQREARTAGVAFERLAAAVLRGDFDRAQQLAGEAF